ncbi:hypothetical protein C1I59_13470 [Paenibacillus polymyxa]|uniref:hypothetical protein n=1 Tax=Paenibacillus polymyxa TaxID=1406 RepID=UPI0010BF10F4|nr:hypothetical protein [Paenibacillus polymyxa]TKH35961.1 hypothetical protein C1I59_13470 [Paenibacillus polymyxa]
MTTVRVLVDAVGQYNSGDIVTDAPDGLVDIAKKEIRNAATGQLLAEIVDGNGAVDGAPSERELQLESELERSKAREAELLEQIDILQSDGELKELKATAKELKIPGYTKMDVDELKQAIGAAGGGADGK